MTNAEFQVELERMYQEHPIIAKRKQKTLNELVYTLRMSGENYQLNTFNSDKPFRWGVIPGVQDTFIPVKDLMQNVVSVEFDEETYEEMGIKLLLVTVED
jgi:hypothetical protein